MTDLSHLLPEARVVAELPDQERVDHIRSEEWWVGYRRAQAMLERLEDLFRHGPGQLRPPNLLILGPTNNGKSMIAEKFRRDHEAGPTRDADAETIPVVAVQMPTEPTVTRFYASLLSRLGAPTRPGLRKYDLEQILLRVLRGVKARALLIDELHNMLAGAPTARREFLNLLRWLGNELRIPLVGLGTRDAYIAIRSDPQLENRFEPLVLPLWKAGPDATRLLASFAAALPLRQPSELHRPDLIHTVLTRSGGTIGEITALLRAAAVAAVGTDEAITERTLELAEYRGPAERRHAVEHELA